LSVPVINRQGGAPRSVLILVLLLVVATGALFLTRRHEPAADLTLGGPLFPVAKDDIEGLLITRPGEQFRLDRAENGRWSLTGAVSDYVDSLSVDNLLNNLVTAYGGALLPGTDVEDRRYEFNGPSSVRLTVFVAGGEPISLALGAGNPVGGNFYASGAGREACFLVSAGLRKTLDDLPILVQSRKLLPGVTRDKVDMVELFRGSREFLLERRDGRWWILMPEEGPAFLGPEVRDYQAMYDDRRMSDDRGTWILASSAAVHLLIYEVSDIIVRDIKTPEESTAYLDPWSLAPPWRQVTLGGKGLNPDPAHSEPDRMTIAFGPALGEDAVPALRRGIVLVTDGEALNVLKQPLGILAHRTALTSHALQADGLEVRREDRLLVRGARTGVAETTEGRKAWMTEFPGQGQVELADKDRHRFSQDLVVNLDRIEVLTVLPPTGDPGVLADRERVRISLTFGAGENTTIETLEIGYLVEENLPVGSPPLTRGTDGDAPVGLWIPGDGKLMQVPSYTVVTARNLAQIIPPETIE
jgi:hypothetical protein